MQPRFLYGFLTGDLGGGGRELDDSAHIWNGSHGQLEEGVKEHLCNLTSILMQDDLLICFTKSRSY